MKTPRRGKLKPAEQAFIAGWLMARDGELHTLRMPYSRLPERLAAETGFCASAKAIRRIVWRLHRARRLPRYQGATDHVYALNPRAA